MVPDILTHIYQNKLQYSLNHASNPQPELGGGGR